MASLLIRSNCFCTSISTGKPWVSHPALRSTMWPSIVFQRQTMSLNRREITWWIPGLPFAVGGPSRKVKGDAPSRRASMLWANVFSSLQACIRAVSRATGSSSPAGFGTTIGRATCGRVLKLRGSPKGRLGRLGGLWFCVGRLRGERCRRCLEGFKGG